jgi:membrane protein implicated in regulation of membrane protease activity
LGVKYLYKKLGKDIPTTPATINERIIGQVLIVQLVNWKKVVSFEGVYFPIKNEAEVNVWDNVKVVKFEENSVIVEKLF